MVRIYTSKTPIFYMLGIFFIIIVLLLSQALRDHSITLLQYILATTIFLVLLLAFAILYTIRASINSKGYVQIPGIWFGKREYYMLARASPSFRFHVSNISTIRTLTDSEKKQLADRKSTLLFAPLYLQRSHLTNVNNGIYIKFKKPLEYKILEPGDLNPDKTPMGEIYFSLDRPERFIRDVKELKKIKEQN